MPRPVLVIYDLPEALKIPNPAAYFRRFGRALNQSGYFFPPGTVPLARVERLRTLGAIVWIIDVHESSWETVVAGVRLSIQKQMGQTLAKVSELNLKCRVLLADAEWDSGQEKAYRRWRAVLAKARRECLAAEECALGWGITRDVADGVEAVKLALSAGLNAAMTSFALKKEVCDGVVA
jgi:hypothetical protein